MTLLKTILKYENQLMLWQLQLCFKTSEIVFQDYIKNN